MSLRDEVHANPACAAALVAKNFQLITHIMSVGRVKPNFREVGTGTILDVLGLTVGTAVIDAVYTVPAYKYVRPLIEQGRLHVGSPLVKAALQQLVGGEVLSQAGADALVALGYEPNPYTYAEMEDALFNKDGTEK